MDWIRGLDWMTVIQRKRAESYHFFHTHPEMEGSEWTGSGARLDDNFESMSTQSLCYSGEAGRELPLPY